MRKLVGVSAEFGHTSRPLQSSIDLTMIDAAADIRVLTDQEMNERLTWARVGALAQRRHPHYFISTDGPRDDREQFALLR